MMFSKTGTAEMAADPMPPNQSDGFVILKPQKDWPKGVHSKSEAVERILGKAEPLLGNNYEVTQPIQMRFNELVAGVRGAIGRKGHAQEGLGQLRVIGRVGRAG